MQIASPTDETAPLFLLQMEFFSHQTLMDGVRIVINEPGLYRLIVPPTVFHWPRK
jgi:hypothetical protein